MYFFEAEVSSICYEIATKYKFTDFSYILWIYCFFGSCVICKYFTFLYFIFYIFTYFEVGMICSPTFQSFPFEKHTCDIPVSGKFLDYLLSWIWWWKSWIWWWWWIRCWSQWKTSRLEAYLWHSSEWENWKRLIFN